MGNKTRCRSESPEYLDRIKVAKLTSKTPQEPIQVVLPKGDHQDVDIYDVSLMLCLQCVEDAHVDVAGVMLHTSEGLLQWVASSNESPRMLELFELQLEEGPSAECFKSGPISNHLFEVGNTQWPKLSARAIEQGFSTMHCIPMRLEEKTIGVLNCFASNERWLGDHDLALVQDMADIATIAIFESQLAFDATKLNEHLATALESRIVIEQAKGIMSQSLEGDIEAAFQQIRAYSRNNNLGLSKVARDVCDGTLLPASLIEANAKKSKPTSKR